MNATLFLLAALVVIAIASIPEEECPNDCQKMCEDRYTKEPVGLIKVVKTKCCSGGKCLCQIRDKEGKLFVHKVGPFSS